MCWKTPVFRPGKAESARAWLSPPAQALLAAAVGVGWKSLFGSRPRGTVMDNERRKRAQPHPVPHELTRGLNTPQLVALAELEHFGWQLKFVRRPLFQPIVPVVFSPDQISYAVLRADGSVDEHPRIVVRVH
jgi:hypothetical protein